MVQCGKWLCAIVDNGEIIDYSLYMQTFTEHADKVKVKFEYYINSEGKFCSFSYKPTDWPIVVNTGKRRQVKGKKYAVILCGDFLSDIENKMYTYLGRWPRKRKLTAAKE